MFTYLDAATGSMIVSAIAGGAAGLSVAGKMGMRRFKSKFGRSGEAELDEIEETEAEFAPETAS